jgi:RimJ/RimL family protein N-acetyltransferase
MELDAVPVLTTARLILRGPRRDDFADCAAMWSDPEVTRFISGRPSTQEESWTRLLRNVGHWVLQGFGYWIVRERATGRFVGEVGLADLHRDGLPELVGVPEAGWVLARWCAGQGLATEAVTAALAWSEAALRAARVRCIISQGHAASRRVAQKCGFAVLGEASYKGEAVTVLERAAATGT